MKLLKFVFPTVTVVTIRRTINTVTYFRPSWTFY